jgi:RHS repeat-associated protein
MTTQTYSQSYTYDSYGNRFQSANTTLGLPAVASTEINAGTNRFITTGSTPTTYDAAGNITTDTKFRNLKYEYDANGRQSAVKLPDTTSVQSSVYDCAGRRVQTTEGSVVRTMVYDVFGQNVADYLGSGGATLERENIYRGGQLLATNESLSAGVPSSLAATPSSSNIALSWTGASGASKYRVERKAAGSSYSLLTTTTSTSTTDSGASSGSAYLYRVCAADGSGNCTSDYSNIALGAKLNFTTDATIVSYSENPATATEIKAAHITQLRTAINAVRSLAGQSSGTWTHTGLAAGDYIYADDVRDLRSQLNDALVALAIQTSNYTDNTLTSYADAPLNATVFKAVHIRELRTRSTSGAGNSTSGGSSGGLNYVLSDLQGTARAVMNNNGSSSVVVGRHDYLPFGEEIGSGLGLRTPGQGYSASDTNRWKYGMLQRDAATGLDHAGWRKYESNSGRWTSPDPLSGQLGDPQGFNHYTYAANDPVNFVDPSGLDIHDHGHTDTPINPTPFIVTVRGSWDDMRGYLPDWTSDNLSMLLGQFLMLQGPASVASNSIVEAKKLLAKDKCRDFVQNVLGISTPDGLIPLIEKAVLTSHPDAYSSDGQGVHAVSTWDNQGNYSIDFYKPFFIEQVPKLDSGHFVLSGPVPMEDRPRDPKAQGQDTLHEGIHLWTGKTDIQLASLFQKPGEKPFTDKLKASEFWNQKLKEKCK